MARRPILGIVIAVLIAFPALGQQKPPCAHTTRADIVALDQAFYNNRMGAFQAAGMIYALRRDVVSTVAGSPALQAGHVMVRPDKRPRPLVLRVDQGDCLEITFQNLLNGDVPSPTDNGTNGPVVYNHALFPPTPQTPYKPNSNDMKQAFNPSLTGEQSQWETLNPDTSQPATRYAGVHVNGLNVVSACTPAGGGCTPIDGINADGSWVGANDTFAANNSPRRGGLVAPGASIRYLLYAQAEGPYLLYSTGATNGENGSLGGQLSQGLFGSVTVQPAGTEWYRSQVTRQDLADATRRATAENVAPATGTARIYGKDFPLWTYKPAGVAVVIMNADGSPGGVGGLIHTPFGQPLLDYGAARNGVPILKITDAGGNIVYSDLTAVITGPNAGPLPESAVSDERNRHVYPNPLQPYRELVIHYHDDFETTQAFPEFNSADMQYTLGAARDFFAINYGIGGIGAEILANRLGVGPMASCTTCRFEEFFLSSWTNGDPAQVVDLPANSQVCGDPAQQKDCTLKIGPKATKAFYPDDPSNVYHSYMSDHVKMQILHAGTNITHVHHLHAQQWLHSPRNENGHYRDSQMISPGMAYTMDHVFNGSGNLNKTVGDSIFHCHFYPHFAQGMWSLWRVHDTFEEGTRMNADGTVAGGWNRALPDGEIANGTPTPAIVPLPTVAMAPLPARTRLLPVTVTEDGNTLRAGYATEVNPDDVKAKMNPGYPFFVPGVAGQRAPHPPLDFAWDEDANGNPKKRPDGSTAYLDGGLPRSIALHDPAPYEQQTRWDFSKYNNTVSAVELPEEGTAIEKLAMQTHATRNHPSATPEGKSANFVLNGRPPVPGAPYADPAVDETGRPVCNETRPATVLDPGPKQPCLIRYKAADIQMDLTVNKRGWHFPQTRFLALWGDVSDTLANKRLPQPFFFRANSRQVIEFWHANLVPNYYELDDFQVRTPTDIIGQHIHLVKFDVTSSDGGGNGYNYEDGTFSPEEVRELIGTINKRNGLFTTMSLDAAGTAFTVGGAQRLLQARNIPYFGDGKNGEWVGAQATIQRWYADPVIGNEEPSLQEHAKRADVEVEGRRLDRTLRTVFTHDHFGPSTHQQAGLYAGLLTEPTDSQWRNAEDNSLLGSNANRPLGANGQPPMDGGPTSWQALIVDSYEKAKSYREFALEFQDRQLSYTANSKTTLSHYVPGNTANYTGWSDPANAISPPVMGNNPNKLPAPFPFIVTGSFGTGTYSLNYRNEPLPFRLAPGAAPFASDLSNVFQSITRNDPAMNTQPAGGTPVSAQSGAALFPPPYTGANGTDPYTPLMRAYAGDNVQVRALVGAHMSPQTFVMHGVNWLFEPENDSSGFRAAQGLGISDHYEFLFNIPGSKAADHADYFYSSTSDVNGLQAGNWGIMRAYNTAQSNLAPLPNANPKSAVADCTTWSDAPQKVFNVAAATVNQLKKQGTERQMLFYNRRGRAGSTSGQIVDPSAIVYVPTLNGAAVIPPNSDFEPLILRANAGDCITINVTNFLNGGGSTGFAPAYYNVSFFVPALSTTQLTDWTNFWNQLQTYDTTFMAAFNAAKTNVYGYALPDPSLNAVTITKKSATQWTFTQPANPAAKLSAASYTVTSVSNATNPGVNVSAGILMATSQQAGLHAQLLAFDPATSEGINVGDNPTQTAVQNTTTPQTVKYVWYAGRITENGGHEPVEFGAVNLTPADPLKQHTSGLLGGLIIEPEKAVWRTDPGTQTSATVRPASGTPFREFAAVVQDDVATMQLNQPPAVGPDYTIAGDMKAENPNDPKKLSPVWDVGAPFPGFTFPVPSGAKYFVRGGQTAGFTIIAGKHGVTFTDETAAKAMFDVVQPSAPFGAQNPSLGPKPWGTAGNMCTGQTFATLRAKTGVKELSKADFVCTVHGSRMKGTFVYANPRYDMLIEGVQLGGAAAGQGTHSWTLNGTPQPNDSAYAVQPGQRILFQVGSELHGLAFLAGSTPADAEAAAKAMFTIDPVVAQDFINLDKYIPFIGVPAIPNGWGTAGYGAPMTLALLTVRPDAPAGMTITFECTIHQATMRGTFVVGGPGNTKPGGAITIHGDQTPSGVNTWAIDNPNAAQPGQPQLLTMANGTVYRVRPGDTITFDVTGGAHGLALLMDEATARRIFDITVPSAVKTQAQPQNMPAPPPVSWGTVAVKFNSTTPSANLIATLRVRADVPPSLRVVPFECSVHTSGMTGIIAIGDVDVSAQGLTPVPPNWTRAVNYKSEPLPYRYAAANFLANYDTCSQLSPLGITRALSNQLVLADPQTPIFVAEAGKPARMRMFHPGGNDEETWTLAGHSWQEEPYTNGSRTIGFNPTSQWFGARDQFGPNVSWDLVLDSAGGRAAVPGDYLYRSFIGTDFLFGMWGVMRVTAPGKDALTVTKFPQPGTSNVPADGAMIAGTVTVNPATSTRAQWVEINGGSFSGQRIPVDPATGQWSFANPALKPPLVLISVTCPDPACATPARAAEVVVPAYIPVIQQNLTPAALEALPMGEVPRYKSQGLQQSGQAAPSVPAAPAAASGHEGHMQ